MTLHRLSQQYPFVADFIASEQTLTNYDLYPQEFVRTMFSPNVDDRYNPRFSESFPLGYFLIPLSSPLLQYQGNQHALDRLKASNSTGVPCFRFLVHPTTEETFRSHLDASFEFVPAQRSPLTAFPTSSFRSLVVIGAGEPFVAKVSLLANLTNGSRHIDWDFGLGQHESSLSVAKVLAAQDTIIPFVDEAACGVTLTTPLTLDDDLIVRFGERTLSSLAIVLRALPAELTESTARICSLASASSRRGALPLLFTSGAVRETQPFESLDERVLNPLYAALRRLAVENGIAIEPHCQNVLLQLDSGGRFTGRFYYRDFDVTSFDRVRFPVSDPDEWSARFLTNPKLTSGRTNWDTRIGFYTGMTEQFFGNLIRPLVRCIFEQKLATNQESEEFLGAWLSRIKQDLACDMGRSSDYFQSKELALSSDLPGPYLSQDFGDLIVRPLESTEVAAVQYQKIELTLEPAEPKNACCYLLSTGSILITEGETALALLFRKTQLDF